VELVPALHRWGFRLAIATHSDEAEFGGPVGPETHILGSELANALLGECFDPEVASDFFVVAYNPRVRLKDGKDEKDKEHNLLKRNHMRRIQQHFGVRADEILFFDDTPSVVKDCTETCGVRTVEVNPRIGFQLSDVFSGFDGVERR